MNLLSFLDETEDYTGKILLLDHYQGIGDSLWKTCLHKEIKRRFKGLKLYISSAGNYWKLIYQNNPYIDKLVDRAGNPPYINGVDYYISDQKCAHVVSSYSREMDALDALEIWFGLKIRDKSYWYEITQEESVWTDKFLSKYPRPIVGIQLKASSWVRSPAPEEMLRLIRMLRYNNFTVIVMDNYQFGFKDVGIINMSGGYNIREVASVISKVDLMITPDSGLMHFAGHFRIPTLAIFGGSDPYCRLKYYPTVYPILTNPKLDCQFCWSHTYQCPRGINPAPCLSTIKADNILETIKGIL